MTRHSSRATWALLTSNLLSSRATTADHSISRMERSLEALDRSHTSIITRQKTVARRSQHGAILNQSFDRIISLALSNRRKAIYPFAKDSANCQSDIEIELSPS
jgi:hypothetical protein